MELERLLEWTSWRMEPIRPYSSTHFIIMAVIFAAAAGFGLLMSRKCRRTERILFSFGIYLAAAEFYKQIFLTYVRGGSYSWSDFPFQLCSVPMYLCLLYPVFREKGKRIIRDMLMTYNLIGGVAALLEPTSSFSSYWILTIHSLVWHGCLICIGLYLVFEEKNKGKSGKIRIWIRDYIPVMGLYLFLAVTAVVLNALFRNISAGTMNLFFLGPSYPDMIILNAVYEHAGWFTETVSMMGVTAAAGLGVYLSEQIWISRMRKKIVK